MSTILVSTLLFTQLFLRCTEVWGIDNYFHLPSCQEFPESGIVLILERNEFTISLNIFLELFIKFFVCQGLLLYFCLRFATLAQICQILQKLFI